MDQQAGFSSYECASFDSREDCAVPNRNRTLEDGSQNAALTPHLPFGKFTVRMKTREFRTGSRAARRTIINSARAQNEITAVHFVTGLAYDLDVVDFPAVRTGDGMSFEGAANTPAEGGQFSEIGDMKIARAIFREIEPVAAPGNISRYRTESLNMDTYVLTKSVAGDVLKRDFA